MIAVSEYFRCGWVRDSTRALISSSARLSAGKSAQTILQGQGRGTPLPDGLRTRPLGGRGDRPRQVTARVRQGAGGSPERPAPRRGPEGPPVGRERTRPGTRGGGDGYAAAGSARRSGIIRSQVGSDRPGSPFQVWRAERYRVLTRLAPRPRGRCCTRTRAADRFRSPPVQLARRSLPCCSTRHVGHIAWEVGMSNLRSKNSSKGIHSLPTLSFRHQAQTRMNCSR